MVRGKQFKTQVGYQADLENSCSLFQQGWFPKTVVTRTNGFHSKTPASNLCHLCSGFSPSADMTDRALVKTQPVVRHKLSLPRGPVGVCLCQGVPKPGGMPLLIWVWEKGFEPFLQARVIPSNPEGFLLL